MLSTDKIIEIYCMADDFCKLLDGTVKRHSVADGKKHRNKQNMLSDAEVIPSCSCSTWEGTGA